MRSGFRVSRHASLKALNTFGIDVAAEKLVDVEDLLALDAALDAHESQDLFLLGSGRTVVFVSPPNAVMRILDNRVTCEASEDGYFRVRCAAGKPWHDFVMHTLEHHWYGLENLALIPGTVGASPVQNIGAYGVEIMDRILQVDAWDRQRRMPVSFLHDACDFSYRDSRFKHEPDRYFITHVEFKLSAQPRLVLDYAGIRDELQNAGISAPAPMDVARAVIRQRTRKLPDPAVIGNAGSFFKNPILSTAFADALAAEYPDMPVNRTGQPGSKKLSAAWLIENAGMKGYTRGHAGVSDRHALVLVNHGGASGIEIVQVARDVAEAVEAKFGVPLHPEPRLIGGEW
jgi:UDP-N-acetylmuramate dehydrogenase